MLVVVGVSNDSVVVGPLGGSRIVGRVDVDAVDAFGVGVLEELEGVVVLGLDHEVLWSLRVGSRSLYLAEKLEGGVDRLAEPGYRG